MRRFIFIKPYECPEGVIEEGKEVVYDDGMVYMEGLPVDDMLVDVIFDILERELEHPDILKEIT